MFYFPWPYPDEVLGSLLVRACRHTGLPFAQLIYQLAGYTDRNYLSFLLPQFLAQVGRETGLAPKALLWEHTVFPYVTSFTPPAQVKRLEWLLLHGLAHPSSKTRLVTKALPFRRCCPVCMAEDVAQYGESYWHRAHLLPAVHVCSRHRLPLIVTAIDARRGNGQESRHWNYELPQEVVGVSERPPLAADVLLDLARRSQLFLDPKATHRQGWGSRYVRAAKSKGYVDSRGPISSLVLARDLLAFYGASLLKESDCDYTPQDRRPWPVLMMRDRPGIPFSPVKHVLLQTFLDHCPPGPKPDSPRQPGRRPRDYSEVDESCARQAQQAATALDGRITVKELISRAGCWETFRHKRTCFPKTSAIVAEFMSQKA